MKPSFQTPVMESVFFAPTDILCQSVGGGGGGFVPTPTTTASPSTAPATTASPTRGGDNYKDDIF